MYIEDGSNQDYSKNIIPNRYSWGWLGDHVPLCKKGWSDRDLEKQVLSKLEKMHEDYVVMQHMGHHDCEICQKRNKEPYSGNGSFVIKYGEFEFRCPEMVAHYIREHQYCPDNIVIDAIFHGQWLSRAEERRQFRLSVEHRAKEEKERNEAIEKERISKMTPEEIQAEQKNKIKRIEREKWISEKIDQLHKSNAFIDLSTT